MPQIGVVGYGSRIQGVIQELRRVEPGCEIGAIVDIQPDRVKRDLQARGIDSPGIRFFASVDELLAHGGVDGIFVGTRCDLHTELALSILPSKIPLYLEKPVSTNIPDLMKLRDVSAANPGLSDNVVVSFPLRMSEIVRTVKEIIDSGQIGTVEHVQAVNNVPYGGVYYQAWYRDASIHGGLFLAKTTHDYDYINYVLGLRPVRVAAMASKQIFKGDKPPGLKCSECGEAETCPESPANLRWSHEDRHGEFCVFASDTGNEDSSSALVEYETGMHLSYSQNFFARKKAAARGARFLGYKGTVEFDFYTNEIRVFMHHTPRVEHHQIDGSQLVHFGGDTGLCRNFLDLMSGRDTSKSPLDAGIISALLCIKSIDSYREQTFQEIAWPDTH